MIMPLYQPKVMKNDLTKKEPSNKTYSFCEKEGTIPNQKSIKTK